MFKSISYKRKLYILLGGSLLVSMVVYQFTIAKTINLYKANKDIELKLTAATNASSRIKLLSAQLSNMDRAVIKRPLDSLASTHDVLMSFLSVYCKQNKTILKNFPSLTIATAGEYKIETHLFKVQGDFLSLLQLVYAIEQRERLGSVSSLSFQIVKDFDLNKNVLIATVYLQNIQKNGV